MTEGPFGGPRPFAEGDMYMVIYLDPNVMTEDEIIEYADNSVGPGDNKEYIVVADSKGARTDEGDRLKVLAINWSKSLRDAGLNESISRSTINAWHDKLKNQGFPSPSIRIETTPPDEVMERFSFRRFR